MHKKLLFHILSLIIMGAGTTLPMQAFPTSSYATTSKLATGKWVKITIPENGIYQITAQELTQMGFSNIENVRIYGKGGHPITEKLDGTATDDLQQIPFIIHDNKLCFYGNGPIQFTIENPTSAAHYVRNRNAYSNAGYYFITEGNGASMLTPTQVNNSLSTGNVRWASLDYMLHEQELHSQSLTGRQLLGEKMENNTIDIPYSLPGIVGDSAVAVMTCAAGVTANGAGYIAAKINDANLNFSLSSAKIYAPANSNVYYNDASPYNTYLPKAGSPIPQNGIVNVYLYSPAGTVNQSWLDYMLLTFHQNNSMNYATDNQLRMGFISLKPTDAITLSDASATTQVWNISNPEQPLSYTMTEVDGKRMFSPGVNVSQAQFIAFDPSKQLKSIGGFEAIENQNIHGLPTPDYVIVTCKELMGEAERIAQLHRDNDNMTVHVIDQQLIFNEFSSGTPDAMAIRLMNKMFYDRNSYKFKHLLMFGAGSYDNRGILFKKPCSILTYQTEMSNDEEYSYVSDDFFGLLDDNSGSEPAADYLRLGVGRITCASVEEARSDVDKIYKYVNEPDYGPWRNDFLIIADEYDNGMHAFQAEGFNNILVDELSTGMANNKVYVSQYPLDPTSNFAFEGRKKLASLLKAGQYYMDYVGHAGPPNITHDVNLWTMNEVKTVNYPHMPIFFTACCDVARYDCNIRGIMDLMFHQKDGGAIALITSSRSVFAESNDVLNQAFLRAMFCFKDKGYMPTLGEAYMLSKQYFGKSVNYNKMSFFLLGDPALKVNYPKPYFKITKINGQDATAGNNIATGAMQRITVEAQVYNPNGTSLNTGFNGDATLTIYDQSVKEREITQRINRVDITRDIYYPRDVITQVSGRVVNGVFTAETVIPRYLLSTGGTLGAVKVYAHMDDSDEMVNGSFDKLSIEPYNANSELTVNDNMAPVIEAIYFNDEQEFQDGMTIAPNSTLYIRASDDFAFNLQSQAIGNNMLLQLDGGKTTYPEVASSYTTSDNGRALAITFPMNLKEGKHTLNYTVYDAAGNKASRSITFIVGNSSQMTISVEESPAVNQATFNIATSLVTTPQVTVKVVDNVGNLVWKTTTSNFPCTWDLKNLDGNRVSPGVYKFFGTYEGNGAYGGTNIDHVIVIEPYKTAN